jgi:hypothetical protein
MVKTTTERTTRRAELARLIASVLSHPQTPPVLYNAMADELCDMSARINYHTPEMVEMSLAAFEQRERARNGGA